MSPRCIAACQHMRRACGIPVPDISHHVLSHVPCTPYAICHMPRLKAWGRACRVEQGSQSGAGLAEWGAEAG
eukprot:12211803-Alexandrium_andersonii.AAC.1